MTEPTTPSPPQADPPLEEVAVDTTEPPRPEEEVAEAARADGPPPPGPS